jgi:hypothetical protein
VKEEVATGRSSAKIAVDIDSAMLSKSTPHVVEEI